MLAVDVIFATLLLLGLFLLFAAVRELRRHRWIRGALAAIVAVLILTPVLNTLPAQQGVSGLFARGAWRTADCTRRAALAAMPLAGSDGRETEAESRCAVSLVLNAEPDRRAGVPAADCWSPRADRPNCYSLAAIELGEDGEPLDGRQAAMLAGHLRALREAMVRSGVADPRVYVIAFVHGWRHDARFGDDNVERLRIMASNAAANVTERCAGEPSACGTAVVGVYLGWPGRASFWESGGCSPGAVHIRWMEGCLRETLGGALDALSFPARKHVSDRIGDGLVSQVAALRAQVASAFPGGTGTASRILLLGHSLGGNAVLSGLSHLPFARDGRIGPADLTVLLNPATETSKWTRLAARYRRAWPPDTPPRLLFIATPNSYYRSATLEACRTQRDAHRMTRRCDEILAQQEIVDAETDPAVGSFFHWSQLVVAGPWAPRPDTVGLGHLGVEDAGWTERDARDAYTHFVELNASPSYRRVATSYAAVRRSGNLCLPEPGMLDAARSGWRRPGVAGVPDPRWDFGELKIATLGRTADISTDRFGPVGRPLSLREANGCPLNDAGALRSRLQMNVQFGVGLVPGDLAARERIGPLWGVRAHGSAIYQHGGFMSAPMLCMFNKLALDDPTVPGDPDAHVRHVDQASFVRLVRPECAALTRSREPRR